MRKSFLAVLLVLMLALPLSVLAKEIELVPMPVSGSAPLIIPHSDLMKSESELAWDDGTSASSYFPATYSPYATTFTAPANCHLVRYRFYWYGGGNVNVNCLLYNDDGGGVPNTPTGSTLFTIVGNSGTTTWAWFNVDVISAGVTLTNGQIFHPGWSHASTSAGVMLDNAKGGYSCWLWLGTWYDYSASYTHMMRVVINDDMTAPYADTFNPVGTWQLPTLDSISFHAKDADIGVNASTVLFSADDGAKAAVPGALGFTGTANDYTFTFNVDDGYDFPDGTTTCTVAAGMQDLLGNTSGSSYNWNFDVDGTAPAVSGQVPPDAGYGQPDTTIVFHITDAGIGTDIGSITFTAEDSPKSISQKDTVSLSKESTSLVVSNSKGVIPGDLVIDDSNPNDFLCTFTPTSDLTVGDTITCTVAAGLCDQLGNITTYPIVWHFTVEPYTIIQPTSIGHIKAQYN